MNKALPLLQKPAALQFSSPVTFSARTSLVRSRCASLPPSAPQLTRPRGKKTISNRSSTLELASSVDDLDDFEPEDYGSATAFDLVQARLKWLVFFSVGLVVSAGVIQDFDELLQMHPALSFFLPLIIGYAGNSGSQTTCEIIRALALRQVSFKQCMKVVAKEAAAGAFMGLTIGSAIFAVTLLTHVVGADVGLCVFLTLPVISIWANGLGAFLALASDKLKFDAALTAAPLMTTIVDSTGLVIYFVISDNVIRGDWTTEAGQLVLPLINAIPFLHQAPVM